jgi:hypothetical protein
MAAFASSAVTAITLATVLPKGSIELLPRPSHARATTHLRQLPLTSGSMLAGVVHDGDALFDYASASKREGYDVTLVDAWITQDANRFGTMNFEEALGISEHDRILSVDGYGSPTEWLSVPPAQDYRRHIIELQRDGHRVVISLRKSS